MASEHEELFRRWRDAGDATARNRLAELYLWLVRYVAGRLMVGLPSHFDQGDVEGHGCFGLLEAIDKYDPDRGVRFETYAIPWVRGACLKGIRALQWAPALHKRVRQLEQAQQELADRLGRDASHEELADFLGISAAELDRRIGEMGSLILISLHETFGEEDGDGVSLQERIADPNVPDPLTAYELEERHQRLAAALNSLPEQERLVMALFYYEGLTAWEISALLQRSPARVSQIHSRAVLRLRGKLARMKALLVS